MSGEEHWPSKFDAVVCEYKVHSLMIDIKKFEELKKSDDPPTWIEMSKTGSEEGVRP